MQRWLRIDHFQRNMNWFVYYYQWIKDYLDEFTEQSAEWVGGLGVSLSVVPPLVLYMLIAVLVYWLLGVIGYYLLALLVFWYALDARPLTTTQCSGDTAQQILIHAYERIFAIIFWLLI